MKNNTIKKSLFFLCAFLCLAFVGIVFYCSRNFYFSGNPLAQILFHVIVQIDGANPSFIKGIALQCVIIPLFGALLATVLLYGNIKLLNKLQNVKLFELLGKFGLVISSMCMVISCVFCCNYLGVKEYIEEYTTTTTLYEEEYVDPRKIEFNFPERKRNLIYILLESVETSDYSVNEGGGCENNFIPELYELANENITFNDNKGFYVAPYTYWTLGAMVGQSAGIPLDIPIDENSFVTSNKFLPGAYTLGDVLKDGGYHNVLMLGSEAVFGGREYYYNIHGDYEMCDYNWALANELVTPEEHIWWGMEDYKLFNFAKDELIKLASTDEPFNLTLLTVDTHNPDGLVCEYCKEDYDIQLANVFACSSRLATEFVKWCQQQDFYENTTIVIAGDHESMDAGFGDILSGHDRKVYFTIINPAEGCIETKDRIICSYDIYPTIVSSLGINYDGNRLALGTNLFSDELTLSEKYGKDEFFAKARANSTYYINNILYGFE